MSNNSSFGRVTWAATRLGPSAGETAEACAKTVGTKGIAAAAAQLRAELRARRGRSPPAVVRILKRASARDGGARISGGQQGLKGRAWTG